MEFSKDEVKNKIVWTKGADFTDGSPRYTFEGRDPATTYERFQVVIYTERERRYAHDPGSLCNHYYGYVRDDKMECAETIGPYYSVREAKRRTLELFNLFMQQYANQELDSATSESAVHGHDDQQKHFQYQWAVGTPQRKYRMTQGQLIANAGEIEATRICYNALLTAVFEREQLILLLSNDKPLTSVREAWQAEQAENYDMEFSHTILRFCEDIRQAQQPEMTM